jgi:hypothetical protein
MGEHTPAEMEARIHELEAALFPFANAGTTLSMHALNGRDVYVDSCGLINSDDSGDIAVVSVSDKAGHNTLRLSHFLRARIAKDGLPADHPAVCALSALSGEAIPTEGALLKIYLEEGWDTVCPFDNGLDDEGRRRAIAEWKRQQGNVREADDA